MIWSIERIEDEWLHGGRVALGDSELVRLFNLVESTFGPEWLESQRRDDQEASAGVTLRVADVGQLIDAVADLPGADRVLARLREREPGSMPELLVTAAIRSIDPTIVVTLEPEIVVRGGNRKPDLRIERGPEAVYVEISAAQTSRERLYVQDRIKTIAQATLAATPFGNTSEVYLHRDPDADGLKEITTTIAALCAVGGHHLSTGEIANIVVNYSPPRMIELYHHGDAPRPRTCIATVEESGTTARHTVVRYAFTDQRAAKMLGREAGQLPPGSPGIVVLDVSSAPGGMREWESVLRGRLRPDQHTRVSAVVLLESGMGDTPAGEAWVHRALVIPNEHAARPLPAWALAPFVTWADGDWHTIQ